MRISGAPISTAGRTVLLGAGPFTIGIRMLDWISRWQTLMSLQRYLGLLLNPLVDLLATFIGLAWLYYYCKRKLNTSRSDPPVYDASGTVWRGDVTKSWFKRSIKTVIIAIVSGAMLAIILKMLGVAWSGNVRVMNFVQEQKYIAVRLGPTNELIYPITYFAKGGKLSPIRIGDSYRPLTVYVQHGSLLCIDAALYSGKLPMFAMKCNEFYVMPHIGWDVNSNPAAVEVVAYDQPVLQLVRYGDAALEIRGTFESPNGRGVAVVDEHGLRYIPSGQIVSARLKRIFLYPSHKHKGELAE